MAKERTRVPVDGGTASEPLTIPIGAAMRMGMAPCGDEAEAPQPAPEDRSAAASFSKAVLQRARAGGGKWTVRVLLTPRPDARQLEELAREARRGLGTGARTEDGVLTVQGDIPDRLEDWLKKRGIPKVIR